MIHALVVQTKNVVIKTYICLSLHQGCSVGGMFCRVEHSTEAAAIGLAVISCVWPLWGGAPCVGTDPVTTSPAYSITQPHDGQCQSTATYHTGLNGTNTHMAYGTSEYAYECIYQFQQIKLALCLLQLKIYFIIQCPLSCWYCLNYCACVFTAFLWWRDSRAVADWLAVLLQRDAVWSPGQHGHEGHLLTADN